MDPNCTANYSVDQPARKITFSNLVLTGAGLGFSAPRDANTATVAGTLYWP